MIALVDVCQFGYFDSQYTALMLESGRTDSVFSNPRSAKNNRGRGAKSQKCKDVKIDMIFFASFAPLREAFYGSEE